MEEMSKVVDDGDEPGEDGGANVVHRGNYVVHPTRCTTVCSTTVHLETLLLVHNKTCTWNVGTFEGKWVRRCKRGWDSGEEFTRRSRRRRSW